MHIPPWLWFSNDSDGFKVELRSATSYRIEVRGDNDQSSGGTLSNPIGTLKDALGQRIYSTEVVTQTNPNPLFPQSVTGIDNFGGNREISVILIDVHVTGIYNITVAEYDGSGGGTYTVHVFEAVAEDITTPRGTEQSASEVSQDLPNFITSTGYVQVNGNGATGDISAADDQDAFAVRLNPRTSYEIEVWGNDATHNGGSLSDPQVRLRNRYFDNLTNAHFVEQTNIDRYEQFFAGGIHNADGGSGENSLIPIAVHWEGTYYIQVESEAGQTGTYTVYVKETGKQIRLPPRYLRPGLPHGSSYFPTFSEPDDGDLPADITTVGNVEPVGTRAHGNIENNSDHDYFKVDMVDRYSYRIDVKGSETSALGGTLGDPQAELLNSSGNPIGVSSDDAVVTSSDSSDNTRIRDNNSGAGTNARIEVNASTTGTFYLAVWETDNDATGTYTVQVTILGALD